MGCQTDIGTSDFEKLENELKSLRKRLADKKTLKRDLFMDDVLKNDDSVKFYTGIPSLGCFNLISELLTPQAEKLKYWDKNKDKQMKYQTAPNSKPGPKRGLTLKEDLNITLVRLRLGMMGRQLADIFFCFPVTAQQDLYNIGFLSCNSIERGTSALAKPRGSET